MKKPESGKFAEFAARRKTLAEDPQLYDRVGQRIALAREMARLTQEQLGLLIDEKPLTISRWETAARRPKVEDIVKLAKVLNRDLLFFTEAEIPDEHSLRALHRAFGELDEADREELLAIAELKKRRILERKLSQEE